MSNGSTCPPGGSDVLASTNWEQSSEDEKPQPKGVRYQCDVDGERDLSRRVELGTEVSIKISGTCSYDGLGPSRAVISDIRGIIIFLKQMLASDRDKVNLLSDEDTVINDLNKMIDGTKAFTLILDDPKGVTTIESLSGSHPDGRLKMEVYNHEKGTEVDPSPERGSDDGSPQSHDSTQGFQSFDTKQKCPICNSDDCSSRIMLTTIPHFEEVCIWAILCNECGYKNTSIDPTSEVPDKGRRITLKITHPQDFDRYVLQSKSTRIIIEELGLEATLASNSGQFTTIEGILKTMYDTYRQTIFVNTCQEGSDSNGDSDDEAAKFKDFIERFGKVASLEVIPLTFILDDPKARARIQNLHAPDEDPNMKIEQYDRSALEEV